MRWLKFRYFYVSADFVLFQLHARALASLTFCLLHAQIITFSLFVWYHWSYKSMNNKSNQCRKKNKLFRWARRKNTNTGPDAKTIFSWHLIFFAAGLFQSERLKFILNVSTDLIFYIFICVCFFLICKLIRWRWWREKKWRFIRKYIHSCVFHIFLHYYPLWC